MRRQRKTIQKIWTATMIALIACFAVLGNIGSTQAQITQLLGFQGKITNLDGTEVTDGNYDFTFSLYTAPSGGTRLWTEDLMASTTFSAIISSYDSNTGIYTYSGANATSTLRVGQYLNNSDTGESVLIVDYDGTAGTVTVASSSPAWSAGQDINTRPYVEGGVIDINLGSVSDLSGVNFNQPLYLEITFNGETMQPRKLIVPVEQAMNADRLDGYDSSYFVNTIGDITVTGQWTFENAVAIVVDSIVPALSITQNGVGNIISYYNDTMEVFTVTSGGNVGIGTSTPENKLDVYGDIGIRDQNELRLYELALNGANYAGFRASSTLASDLMWTLPTTQGLAGQSLMLDSVGNLYWGDVGAGTITSGTAGQFPYFAADGTILTATSNIFLTPTGNFGLGTTTPENKLAIVGDLGIYDQNELRFYEPTSVGMNYVGFRASSTVTTDLIWTLPTTAGTPGQTMLVDSNGNLEWGAAGEGAVSTGLAGQIGYYLSDGDTITGTSTMFITPTGNIGIGTTSPNARLEVLMSGGGVNLRLDKTTTNPQMAWAVAGVDKWNVYVSASDDSFRIRDWGASTDRMVFSSSGNIGIGTTSPLTNLSVQGTAGSPILNIASSTGESIFYINEYGRVGVGTTTPAQEFHVVGSNLLTIFENTDTTANTYAQILLKAGSATSYLWTANQNSTSWGGPNSLNIYAGTGGAMTLSTNATEKVRINTAGNVGIGTTTPNQKLTVFNNAADSAIEFSSASGGSYKWTMGLDYSDAGKFKISSSSALGTSDRLVIDGSGNVGIASSSPSYKLSVLGDVMLDGTLQMDGNLINNLTYINMTAGNGYGLRFWGSDAFKIHMGTGAEYQYGPVTDYSIKSNMDATAGRGWTWGSSGAAPIAAIGNTGNMQIAGQFISKFPTGKSFSINNVSNTSVALGTGVYFDGANWIHSGTAGKQALQFLPGTGVRWFSDTTANNSFSVSNQTLWDDSGAWKHLVQSTQGGNSYFTGGSVGVGTNGPLAKLHVVGAGTIPTRPTYESQDVMIVENGPEAHTVLNIAAPYAYSSNIAFSNEYSRAAGTISYDHTGNLMTFKANGLFALAIANNQYVGVGTTTPALPLHVYRGLAASTRPAWGSGDVMLIENSSAEDTNLQILSSNTRGGYVIFSDDNSRAAGWVGYNHPDNSLRLVANTREGLRVASNGFVGIGETNPLTTLSVKGTAGSGIFNVASSTGTSLMYIDAQGEIGFGTTNPDAQVVISGTTGSRLKLAYAGSAHAASFTVGSDGLFTIESNEPGDVYIDSSSNFGVGTSSPSADLAVYGDSLFEGLSRHLYFGTTTGTTGYGVRDSSGTIQFKNMGGSWNALSIVGSGYTGWFPYYPGTGSTLTATSSIYVNPTTGFIGIGTINATSRLTVDGNIGLSNDDITGISHLDINNTYGYGIRFDGGNQGRSITWGNDSTHQFGVVSSESIKMNAPSAAGAGWTWGSYGETPTASLNTDGTMALNGFLFVGGERISLSASGRASSSILVEKSQGVPFLEFSTSTLDHTLGDTYMYVDENGSLSLNAGKTAAVRFHVGPNSPTIVSSDVADAFIQGQVEFGSTLHLTNQNALRLYEATGNGTNYVAFSATSSIASDVTYTLPEPGTVGQALILGSDNNLYWGSISSGTGSGDVGEGTIGQVPYYSAAGTAVTATSTIFIDSTGYVGIGTTTIDSQLFVDGNIKLTGNLLSYASTTIGSSATRIKIGYFDEIDVLNGVSAPSSANGTDSSTFTINTDNASADAEDSTLAFERGSVTPNATLTWDSTNKRFAINQPFYLDTNNLITLGSIGVGTTTPQDTLSVLGGLGVFNQNALKLYELTANGMNYIGLSATSSVTTSITYTLPEPGTAGQILALGVDNNLYWTNTGAGSGTVNTGTTGQTPYYAADGTAVTATSSIFIDTAGRVGIGTNSPRSKLDINGDIALADEGSFRLYESTVNGQDYIAFKADSSLPGSVTYTFMGSAGTLGQVLTMAADNNLYWGNKGVGTGTTGQISYYAADGTAVAATSTIFIDTVGRVGIGTTTPQYNLHVVGSLYADDIYTSTNTFYMGGVPILSYSGDQNLLRLHEATVNGSNYINLIATSTLASDVTYTLPAPGTAGQALLLGADNHLYWGTAGGGSGSGDVGIGATGQIPYYSAAGTAVTATSSIFIDTTGRIGIGTTTPDNLFHVYGNKTDYLAKMHNVNTTASSSGLSIRVDGTGTLFNLNSNGTDIVTITAAQTLFNNPVSFGSAGDVSMAYDLYFANDTAAYINFNGPGYVRTNSAWQNLDLTLTAANSGQVIVDDQLVITGGATTSLPLLIDSETSSASIPTSGLFQIVSDVTTNENVVFKVSSGGNLTYDGTASSPAADYAEYFFTKDTDLQSGEAVCVDITEPNAVERCKRASDSNVMGIISTQPAIVGNARSEYADNVSYVIVGMLGQVPARVSDENGPIRPGDSLTPASLPGYVMKAGDGDPTVGVALEAFGSAYDNETSTATTTDIIDIMNNGMDIVSSADEASSTPEIENTEEDNANPVIATGEIKVLISRRNKSLTVESVEAKITQHIADMEIEDEVQVLIANAVNNLNLGDEIQPIVDEQIALFDAQLTAEFDSVSNQLTTIAASTDSLLGRMSLVESGVISLAQAQISIQNRISEINEQLILLGAASVSELKRIAVNPENGLIITNDLYYDPTEPAVSVVEIVTATSTQKTAFVVNQLGDGDVVDFQTDGVSIVNVANTGKVSIVGEMTIDGRIMVCAGSGCGDALDNAVDETMGDMGVEGKVVAGAFESICEDGFVWVPGSSKYGTMPGFCVMASEARIGNDNIPTTDLEINGFASMLWTNLSQGEAQLACQSMGDNYHLISENEWLTIAENIIRISGNDIAPETEGLQLATTENQTASTSIAFALSNGNQVYDLAGGVSEWSDMIVTRAGLLIPTSADWQEYYEITDFKGFNIAPPYYYDSNNGIGRIKVEDNSNTLRGFIRGETSLYDLDLSYPPTWLSGEVGFRCAK